MGALSIPRYETKIVAMNSGATTFEEFEHETDKNYDRVTGVAIYYPKTNNTPIEVNIGLSDQGGIIQDRASIKDYLADYSVPHQLRYKPVNVPAKGNKIRITAEPIVALSADLFLHVVFRLERD